MQKFNKINNNNQSNNSESSEKKEREIKHLTNELENLKIILDSYQNQNQKITELEMKLRSQQINFEKKLKNNELIYKEQINNLNSMITNYEGIINKRNSISIKKDSKNKFSKNFVDEENSTLTIVTNIKLIFIYF